MANKMVTLRVDEDLLARFDRWAKSTGRTRTSAVAEFMGRQADAFEGKPRPDVTPPVVLRGPTPPRWQE